MIDHEQSKIAKHPVYVLVSTEGDRGPFIKVAASQVGEVTSVLDAHQHRYTVRQVGEPGAGVPVDSFIELGQGADAAAVQGWLDEKE